LGLRSGFETSKHSGSARPAARCGRSSAWRPVLFDDRIDGSKRCAYAKRRVPELSGRGLEGARAAQRVGAVAVELVDPTRAHRWPRDRDGAVLRDRKIEDHRALLEIDHGALGERICPERVDLLVDSPEIQK